MPVEDFFNAIKDTVPRLDYKGFAAEFDRIVEQHGWSYNGGREWRIRTIFETNVRTSYMAGRLRQMRDPDMVRLRPWWQYWHADTRVPEVPRPEHLGWDGLVLRWDDPWWDTHFPPNDWGCSCGVRTLSETELRRLGKTGPDPAPDLKLRPITHKASGATVMLPEGVGYGWDHMPGDLWDRGLVPSALIEEGEGLVQDARHAVQIDVPSPIEQLVAAGRPFKASPLPEGLPPEDYIRAFLTPFGADFGRAVLWEDVTGTRVPISDAFFRTRDGHWKVEKRNRATLTPLMAETMLDPDEIWIGLAAKPDPRDPELSELLIDRRYIRTSAALGIVSVMEIGRRWWEPVTLYVPNRDGRPSLRSLQNRRGGKLIWKRN